MTQYTFDISVEPISSRDVHLDQALAEAPFDIYVSSSEGAYLLSVYIDSEDEESAVCTVERFLHTICPPIFIKHFVHELVTLPEIAARLGVTHEAARTWARGKRSQKFPAPHQTAGTTQLWSWHEVYKWAMNKPRYGTKLSASYGDRPLSHSGAALANARLQKRTGPCSDPVVPTYTPERVFNKVLDVEVTFTSGRGAQSRSFIDSVNSALMSDPVHMSSSQLEQRLTEARLDR